MSAVQMLFLTLADMSIVSSLVIGVVLLARLALRRAPRRLSYVLWLAVLVRLLCPFMPEGALGLIPERAGNMARSAALPGSEQVTFASAVSAAYRSIGDAANGGLDLIRIDAGPGADSQPGGQTQYLPATHRQVWLLLCARLWPLGAAAVIAWGAAGQLRLRRRLVGAVRVEGNVWLADRIPTAFVIGLLRPRIYLPSGLTGPGADLVLEHERTHIRRGDHVFRLLAFAALALHWFNPLVWIAFALSGRDMEMSCDEAVMRRSGADIRADYCQTLLDMSANKPFPGPCPLAFGEGDTGARVKNALRWKKPALWATLAAAPLCLLVCVSLLTSPPAKNRALELAFPAPQDGEAPLSGYDPAYDPRPFTMSVTLPRGWTAGVGQDPTGGVCPLRTPVYLYDGAGEYAGLVGWDTYGEYDGDVPEEDYYKTVYYSLRLGAHYAWTDYVPFRADEYTETATATVYFQSPDDGLPAASWPQHTAPGICHYDRRLGVYVAIQLAEGAATEKEILEIAGSIALSAPGREAYPDYDPSSAAQGYAQSPDAAFDGADSTAADSQVGILVPGYYYEGDVLNFCKSFIMQMTLPEGWTVTPAERAAPYLVDVHGMLPMAYMYGADGGYAGFIAWRGLNRLGMVNHYSWEDLRQILSGGTDVYTATIVYDVFDEDLLPGYPWISFETQGIRAESEELGVYVCVQLAQQTALSAGELNDMALSISLEERVGTYID